MYINTNRQLPLSVTRRTMIRTKEFENLADTRRMTGCMLVTGVPGGVK